MPWVVADYTSPTLDLSDPATFRDLSRPIGALNPRRLAMLRERYTGAAGCCAGCSGCEHGEGGVGRASHAAHSHAPSSPPSSTPAAPAEMGGFAPEPPFLYGSHYSTPGFTMFWLVRAAPAHMLRLQAGRFDAPDRLFCSVREAWEGVSGSNPADVKELIPEFYLRWAACWGQLRRGRGVAGAHVPATSHVSTPWPCPAPRRHDFLRNLRSLALGTRQSGRAVGDVELPPWAAGSPQRFQALHRAAMEAPFVSANLHHWIGARGGGDAGAVWASGAPAVAAVSGLHLRLAMRTPTSAPLPSPPLPSDLVFGCKQRGGAAVEADNVFRHTAYEGAVDIEAVTDRTERAALEMQVCEWACEPGWWRAVLACSLHIAPTSS